MYDWLSRGGDKFLLILTSTPLHQGNALFLLSIDAVKKIGPPANSATFVNPCNGPDGKCTCYAKYGMEGWDNRKQWISCKFSEMEGNSQNLREFVTGPTIKLDFVTYLFSMKSV